MFFWIPVGVYPALDTGQESQSSYKGSMMYHVGTRRMTKPGERGFLLTVLYEKRTSWQFSWDL
jgi:hypothetical protein